MDVHCSAKTLSSLELGMSASFYIVVLGNLPFPVKAFQFPLETRFYWFMLMKDVGVAEQTLVRVPRLLARRNSRICIKLQQG